MQRYDLQKSIVRKSFATRHAPEMIALALIGLAVAAASTIDIDDMIYNGLPLWCPPPIDGCNEVAASPYARILGLPVGYYGVVFYLYMVGLAVLLALDPHSSGLRLGVILCAGLGVLFSLYFMVLQVAFIRAFCIYLPHFGGDHAAPCGGRSRAC